MGGGAIYAHIDNEKAHAVKAERVRLGRVFAEWRANGMLRGDDYGDLKPWGVTERRTGVRTV